MNLQIISEETIKPSSPTPPHLGTYKLSLFDQLAPPVYIPIVLFYSAAGENSNKTSDLLKHSLSKTLTKFYPFAGRIKDAFSIDCNEHGALYTEAKLDFDMCTILQQPEVDMLQQLLPCNPRENPRELSTQELLAVRVNYFRCGGMAIGLCIRHAIADASAAANFVKSWAAISCGANVTDEVIIDCTSLFPPQNILGFSKSITEDLDLLLEVEMKRFLFDGAKIAALQEKIGSIGPNLHYPTRVEAVSALMWDAVMSISRERDETITMHVATTAVNLRKRMNPPLPQQSIGNIYQVATANSVVEKTDNNYNSLAGKIHESITKMNDEYVRKLHAGGGYLNFIRNTAESLGKSSKIEAFAFSSWCRFPFYEADFGWGKPLWLSTALKLNNIAIFLDTSDGKGIEAWVGLSEQDMEKFERDPGILAYTCFRPSTLPVTLNNGHKVLL